MIELANQIARLTDNEEAAKHIWKFVLSHPNCAVLVCFSDAKKFRDGLYTELLWIYGNRTVIGSSFNSSFTGFRYNNNDGWGIYFRSVREESDDQTKVMSIAGWCRDDIMIVFDKSFDVTEWVMKAARMYECCNNFEMIQMVDAHD